MYRIKVQQKTQTKPLKSRQQKTNLWALKSMAFLGNIWTFHLQGWFFHMFVLGKKSSCAPKKTISHFLKKNPSFFGTHNSLLGGFLFSFKVFQKKGSSSPVFHNFHNFPVQKFGPRFLGREDDLSKH